MSYAQLEAHQRKLAHLGHVQAMVEWDQAAMMPTGGGPARAEALGTLEELKHSVATRPELGDWIAAAEGETLKPWQAANLRELRRAHRRATQLPAELVGARARAQSTGHMVWQAARPNNDWGSFAPALEKVVALEREAGQLLGADMGCSAYEALLDTYEPGASIERIDQQFAELKAFLVPFIPEAIARAEATPSIEPRGPFPVEAQRKLGLALMADVGFDFERGRLDVSAHPFCGGVPSDVRITTRYDENDFCSALMGVLHETGHAKYEQGLPQAWTSQPVGQARSMSFHESQSLLQEMQISRGRPFLEFAAPKIRAAFPDATRAEPQAFELGNLARHFTQVRASKIRVDADEVTYPCHVMLRTAIERDLIAGTMTVAELPERWDQEMQELLGLDTRGDYKDGCMQDIHWAAGAFGYFPTYTLGAMRAAQLFAALRRAHPSVDTDISQGRFETINAWLREQVWGQASVTDAESLMVAATGQGLGTADFVAHLKARYGPSN